jgi:thiol-disulfide isomerase/thioredoxin
MKKLLIFVIILIPLLSFSQKKNQKTTDPKKNNEMLIGFCNRDGFSTINSNFDSAYRAGYASYKPDETTLKELSGKLKRVKITIVMATWCGDSKDWVPRFYKIMDEAGFRYKNLTLISVDREKKAPGTNVETYKVDLVPTFIFYRKKAELGRIIEFPLGIFEKEILKILSKKVEG